MSDKSFYLSLFLFYTTGYAFLISVVTIPRMTLPLWIVYLIGWMLCNVITIHGYLKNR
jgi:hypothetical protein